MAHNTPPHTTQLKEHTHTKGAADDLICRPLNTYDEILAFRENPPSWRSLCKELQPHSKKLIKNLELNKTFSSIALDCPQTFCHFDPDAEDAPRHDAKSLPKTLVCHDMANGYHDDSYIDGTSAYDAYTFYNWAGIDIFCYFSHHLLTIPPLGWINVGHAHGVKVIGTVITEWAEGIEFWNLILGSESEYQSLADALVTIAKTLKFDGWLLNIENKVSKPDVLLEFVHYLHRKLHQELPDPVLIWYDSVTIDGHLNWQNKLNAKNKAFFDACDGLFTNYSWSESDVATSAANAGDRLTDLFIGIDVWGRNFYGGGQFNTQEAVEVAHSYGCSLAIFAPAWTHEANTRESSDLNTVAMSDDLSPYDCFLLRDRALWGSLWPYLNTSLPCHLPFQTSFCRGQGKKRRLYGEVLCPGSWYNLRHMQYQPNSAHGSHGYLLSTVDNIIQVSRHGVSKDKKGIIRYRESFQMSRQEIHSVKSRDSATAVELNDSVTAVADLEHTSPEERDTMKRKVRNAFVHLFRPKSRKILEEEEKTQENKEENEEDDDDDDENVKSGWSMLQVSVNINLREHDKKTRYAIAYVPGERPCLEPYFEDSFIGGSCLKVTPSDVLSPDHRTTRLFHCDFACEESLIVCVVSKELKGFEKQFLNVIVHAVGADGRELRAQLVGRDLLPHSPRGAGAELLTEYPLNVPGTTVFRDLQKYILLNEPGFYISVENAFGWKVRYYEVKMRDVRVTSVNCRTGLEEGPVLLGYLGLCQRKQESEAEPPVFDTAGTSKYPIHFRPATDTNDIDEVPQADEKKENEVLDKIE